MQRVGIIPQKDIHIHQNVVEVHHARRLELLLIQLIHFRHTAPLRAAVRLQQVFAGGIAVPGDQVVLGVRDAPQHILRFVVLVLIQMQLLQADFNR